MAVPSPQYCPDCGVAGQREPDRVERLGALVGIGRFVIAAEFGDRHAEHVGDALEDRHAVNGPYAALDLRDPAL